MKQILRRHVALPWRKQENTLVRVEKLFSHSPKYSSEPLGTCSGEDFCEYLSLTLIYNTEIETYSM